LQAMASAARYPLSLHDALPISWQRLPGPDLWAPSFGTPTHGVAVTGPGAGGPPQEYGGSTLRDTQIIGTVDGGRTWEQLPTPCRSEEHTSELQSRSDLVCRLLL